MDLLHLVDRLEELVTSAQRMPIGGRSIIDRRGLLDVVDQMRVVIPQEVREARELVDGREQFQREAEEEARMIVARAEEQAAHLVDDHQIIAAAHLRAQEVGAQSTERLEGRIAEANADIQARLAESSRIADQQMSDADEYSRDLLRRLERQLTAFVGSVHAGIAQLGGAEDEPAAQDAPPVAVAAGRGNERGREAHAAPSAREPVPAGAGAATATVEPSPAAAPILLRGDAPQGDDESDHAGGAVGDLENLLAPPPRPAPPAGREEAGGEAKHDAEDGEAVIDDFALPRLDDERTHTDPDAEERPPV